MSAETLVWADVGAQLVTLLVAAAALVIASLRVRVNAEAAKADAVANDRKQELMMQGLFVQWSQDMREELRTAQTEIRTLQGIVQNQQNVITRGRLESDRLLEQLTAQKELHKEREGRLLENKNQLEKRLETLMAENGELRQQVGKLQDQVDTLNKRVEEVEKRARENERALEAERDAREKLQHERDMLQRERDAIAMERDSLRVKVVELENALKESRGLVEGIRKELDALKAQVEKRADDAATT